MLLQNLPQLALKLRIVLQTFIGLYLHLLQKFLQSMLFNNKRVTFSLGDVHLFGGLVSFFPVISEEEERSAGETQNGGYFLEDLHFNYQILQINYF